MQPPQSVPDRLPTQPLYHYSSPSGMLGMLESKSLWMSNIRYQNDAEEYKHAYTLFEQIIHEEYEGFDLEKLLGYTKLKNEFIPPVFTFSLTEEKDLLSQWRGYASDGGYSFALNRAQLNAFMHRHYLVIHQCIYEENAQKAQIRRDVIQFSSQEWADVHTGKKSMDVPMLQKLKLMLGMLAWLAPILKHNAFKEEKEWRLIKKFNNYDDSNRSIEQQAAFENIRIRPVGTTKANGDFLNFREDKGILVPYLCLPLVENIADPNQFVELDEVIVGPGVRQDIAVPACKTLLKGWGLSSSVVASAAPYRK